MLSEMLLLPTQAGGGAIPFQHSGDARCSPRASQVPVSSRFIWWSILQHLLLRGGDELIAVALLRKILN